VGPAEGHEGQVDRVQHDLHAHEDRDDVAPKEDAERPHREQEQAQEERVLEEGRSGTASTV